MPAAASQLKLQWQLQQQGGSDRAELSPARPCASAWACSFSASLASCCPIA